MSDYKKINDSRDSFSEHFRQRLIDKPTPPDANCWDEIEARLPKRRAISPAWLSLAIAASVIIAVFILNNVITENDRPAYSDELVLKENKAEHTEKAEGEEKAELIESTESIKIAKAKTTAKVEPTEKKSTEKEEQKELTEQVEQTELAERKEIAEKEEFAENVREDNADAEKKVDRLQYRSDEKLMAYDEDKKRYSGKNRNWLTMAGLGSAGGLGYLLSSVEVFPKNKDLVFADSPKDLVTSPGSDEEHNKVPENVPVKEIINTSMPVSFGFTVRKKINKTIGIETGLLYTYLSSDFRVSGTDHSGATLNLHYLGIPVNLTVNLWDKKRWNFYASGGGMVDKGLQSVYIKKGNGMNDKERNSISGLQWSLNSGLGVSYNLYKYMNLYLEPGFSYYFDCNQPVSRRTENPFSFNLRVGLRYDF